MRGFFLIFVASVFAFSTGALARQAGQGTGPNNSGPGEFNRQQNFRDFQVGVVDSNRLTMRPVPVSPGDIVQGLEVHDAKGLVIGKVGTVGTGFATVTSTIGSVEVDFPSFAKNKNGLLINIPKSKIDALMARSHPAP
ncbi:hypothetical protein C8J46_10371 [Sphingomonas sp. PP-F2F-A104-K0414]|jgi:hypothetical protein|uniref:hypothetical protein n=1 Tax=Sphingomonas sp. PP-F2F-A104-K0414 TaxID=2135661 RepID=UPI0010441615|nr:hypothetical protein [Sphingomonas sp. PP-F2F-A104-K0414]TCP99185.1 hypothetical protein C8J46_10371 [Sphingomonas sp. PP-F2F-A104-K0414]